MDFSLCEPDFNEEAGKEKASGGSAEQVQARWDYCVGRAGLQSSVLEMWLYESLMSWAQHNFA